MNSLGKNSIVWSQPDLAWDGTWTITFKSGLSGLAAEWLDQHLTRLLSDVPGFDDGVARVYPADWYEEGDRRTGVREWGAIVLGNLPEALPEIAPLQETMEAAGNEALMQGGRLEAIGSKFIAEVRAREEMLRGFEASRAA